MENTKYVEYLMNQFYSIGMDPLGGVTRLGYTRTEDEMHQQFVNLSKELGLGCYVDQVGNTFVGDTTASKYILLGSHLDSVNEGGRFDGVAGIVAALQIVHWMQQDDWEVPLRIGAFRCEESSNFGQATLGSGFITGTFSPQSVKDFTGQKGKTLEEIFKERGYSLNPTLLEGVLTYLELHIEQSTVLETYGNDIGIVTTIKAATRFSLDLYGQANHSGGTPMDIRKDALAAAAEVILATERIGQGEKESGTVATVGVIQNQPNVINAIPGHVELKIDIRGIDHDSIQRSIQRLQEQVEAIGDKRQIQYTLKLLNQREPVPLSLNLQNALFDSANSLGYSVRRMPSGAGHDAMNFPSLCETGMVFVPCRKGVSHSKEEFVTPLEIIRGARVIYECLRGKHKKGLLS